MGAEERKRLRERYQDTTAADVSEFMERLPRDMLFVMRMWALVRSLNRALGGTTRQRFLVIAGHASHGAMNAACESRSRSWLMRALGGLVARFDSLRVKLYVLAYDAALTLVAWRIGRVQADAKPPRQLG